MQIFFKNITGKARILDVEPSDLIRTGKAQLEVKDGIPVNQQIFVFAGKVLEDGKTFADYNIQRESTLTLLMRVIR